MSERGERPAERARRAGDTAGFRDFSDYGRPIRVEGGLRARSARGAIGESWWSKRFLAVLESFALGGRLTRGRSYARAGQVLAIDVEPGRVTASVQGSRPTPYAVKIGLVAFPADVWERVERDLAAQALFTAQLLAGEMPHEIEDVFAAAGSPLFPGSLADLDLDCSCPDWGVPCKHLAATFYLLAEEFDADPFRILYWRGRDRETLLASLRALRGGADEPAGSAVPPVPIGAVAALADLAAPPLADTVDRFWVPPVPLPARPPTLDVEPDVLLRQLPEPGPDLGGQGLVDRLRGAYQQLSDLGGEP